MYRRIHCSNSSPILELSVKFASQVCHENINKPQDGSYLAAFGIDITPTLILYLMLFSLKFMKHSYQSWRSTPGKLNAKNNIKTFLIEMNVV